MTLFGYRLPMMTSILVWCLLWEIVGQTGLMYLVPPFRGAGGGGRAGAA